LDKQTDDDFGPFMARQLLGEALRKLRGNMPLAKAAEATHLSEASISRIENGKQAILPRNVQAMCDAYGADAETKARLVHDAETANAPSLLAVDAEMIPDWAEPFVEMEAEASEIWSYEAQAVPGLLQVPDYIRALVEAAHAEGADVERSVELRTARQRRLTGPRPPTLHVVLDEAVLKRQVGGPKVMQAQMDHLVAMNALDHVTIQILPFEAGAHAAMTGSFTELHFRGRRPHSAVFLEHDHAGLWARKPKSIARYNQVFDLLREAALTAEESHMLLASLALQYPG